MPLLTLLSTLEIKTERPYVPLRVTEGDGRLADVAFGWTVSFIPPARRACSSLTPIRSCLCAVGIWDFCRLSRVETDPALQRLHRSLLARDPCVSGFYRFGCAVTLTHGPPHAAA